MCSGRLCDGAGKTSRHAGAEQPKHRPQVFVRRSSQKNLICSTAVSRSRFDLFLAFPLNVPIKYLSNSSPKDGHDPQPITA
jgi:hypothetical protein